MAARSASRIVTGWSQKTRWVAAPAATGAGDRGGAAAEDGGGASSDGSASIVYVYGPLGSNNRRPGGVLHGTGIIRDGELRFQNSDGTQFAFRPLYADLDGRLTTPQGQSYQSVFKKAL